MIEVFGGFTLLTQIYDYTGLTFTRKYRGSGTITLTVNNLDDAVHLVNGNYLVAKRDAYVIESVHKYANAKREIQLEVSGRHINSLLNRRVAGSVSINTSSPIEAQLRQLVTDHCISPADSSRRLPGLVLGNDAGISKMATTAYTISGDNGKGLPLDHALNIICGNSDLGWRLDFLPEAGQFAFRVLQGHDLTGSVIFADEFGNVYESDLYDQESNYYNVAYKDGAYSGAAAGLDRREIALGDNEVLSDYSKLLSAECVIIDGVQFAYREDWDLGDSVSFVDKTLGYTVTRPVLEVKETQGQTVDIEATFGDRIPTVFDVLKK